MAGQGTYSVHLKRNRLSGYTQPVRYDKRFPQEIVTLYQIRSHSRSRVICDAVERGLELSGYQVDRRYEDEYNKPISNTAIFYGYIGNLPRIMQEYHRSIYIDLGYWNRKNAGRYRGYHKICVNSRHPTEHFQKFRHDESRLKLFEVEIKPWRENGNHILVAGMSAKASKAAGFRTGEWEKQVVDRLLSITDRPIHYRPKPNCKMSKPIPGTVYCKDSGPIINDLEGCHALVAYQSNSAVDAVLNGVPVFVENGAALPMAKTDLSEIENPYYPNNRRQWAADIAWTQWTVDEMKTPAPWLHMQKEGLL